VAGRKTSSLSASRDARLVSLGTTGNDLIFRSVAVIKDDQAMASTVRNQEHQRHEHQGSTEEGRDV
jgi:hypothetical protein